MSAEVTSGRGAAGALIALACAFGPHGAAAQVGGVSAPAVAEARVGVASHDVTLFNSGTGGTEAGLNLSGEIVLESPSVLARFGAPRPYAGFSWNSAGATNFGGVGLTWATSRERRLYGVFDLGVVLHDGVVDLPSDPDDPVRQRLADTRVIFGSRDLFRTAIGAGWRMNARWDAQVVVEHLSHGQILGSGKNEGLDNLGVRFAYRFAAPASVDP